jgi:hypothetical protein
MLLLPASNQFSACGIQITQMRHDPLLGVLQVEDHTDSADISQRKAGA